METEQVERIHKPFRQTDGEYRLDHAVTATQKAILKAFKMDATYIQRETAKIRDGFIHWKTLWTDLANRTILLNKSFDLCII